jgi:rubrerythrin
MLMNTQTQANNLGMNRTGLQMSPQDSQDLLENSDLEGPVDSRALASVREQYISEADPLGSIPLPGSIKGLAVTGAKMLTGKHPEMFIDKLAERLAFERTGTRIYDALIAKFNASVSVNGNMSEEDLIEIRNEEAKHFQMLSETIRSLGGDPTAQTPSADLVGVESMGLVQAVTDPRTTFADCLHVVLTAELADVDGWDFLATFADAAGEEELAARFREALSEEGEHLTKVRAWYQQLSLEPLR